MGTLSSPLKLSARSCLLRAGEGLGDAWGFVAMMVDQFPGAGLAVVDMGYARIDVERLSSNCELRVLHADLVGRISKDAYELAGEPHLAAGAPASLCCRAKRSL